jgi:predicted RecB family nuclease
VQRVAGGFIYSASDLHNDLECRRLTWLEQRVALGEGQRPDAGSDSGLIAEKGTAHEERYLAKQRERHGDALISFETRVGAYTREAMRAAEELTLAAMASGAPVIYQATFFDETFLGRADFLRRVETPSARWEWSYEIVDTKLATKPKAHFLLQLCNYSEHLARLQGTPPVHGHLVLGSGVAATFRIDDYAAYYRHQKAQFLARVAAPVDAYPAEIGHCALCSWSETCEAQREADAYLGIVAGMSAPQIKRLEAGGIATIAALACARDDERPLGMATAAFAKLRAQAALQDRQRRAIAANLPPEQTYFYELLDHDPKLGFGALPEPAAGDVYFDMEGDPLYSPERGLEYLFGVHLGRGEGYRAFWAHDLHEERAAFEQFIDFIVERRARFPGMHVYHYAPYETVALRRLMGVYGTREAELDTLLRAQVFVDLYAVVRQAVRISQPSYSIKKLEPFYGMSRATDVKRGDDSIVKFEEWIASGDQRILDDIEQYNNDDCRSTLLLHEWLLKLRGEHAVALGREPDWRAEPGEPKADEESPLDGIAPRLLGGLPDLLSLSALRAAEDDVRARWLLGHLLQYHKREAKPTWWKLFDRYDYPDQMTEFDHEAIGDLTLCADVPPYKLKARDRNLVYTYAFPDQQYNLKTGGVHDPHLKQAVGTLVAIDDDANRLAVKLNANITPNQLRALVPGGPIDTKAQRSAIARVATAYEAGTIRADFPAIYDLLTRAIPRIAGLTPGAVIQPERVTGNAIAELARSLDRSYLFVQGPPGSGKSTTGGAAIATLLQAGLRVGIVSHGYAAIQNLLHKVEEAALARGFTFAGLHKHSGEDKQYISRLRQPMVQNTTDNDAFVTLTHQLAAGTPWLFSRADLEQRYDVLFMDEAGQLSLGDAIACAVAAKNIVLLGDPLQLAQVSAGSHPLGTGPSVLEHLLGTDHTVAPERGVFLDVSYRMHPDICAFISQTVYDGRLHASATTERNSVSSPGLAGAGLRFMPVVHTQNSRESPEEADRIADEVEALLRGEVTLGAEPPRALTQHDILVVTPYNAQRTRINRTLITRGFGDVRVGTVDKFQGQEAAVVFYSMATSSSAEMPRNLSFLFEKNRFNVAISRAQCLSIVVCSPQLLEVRCKTPDEMLLASLLCAFAESAASAEAIPA